MIARSIYPKKGEVYVASNGSRHLVIAVAMYERFKQSLIVLEDLETGHQQIVSPADFSVTVTRQETLPDGSKFLSQAPAYELVGVWVDEASDCVEDGDLAPTDKIDGKVYSLKEGSGF